MRKLISNFIAEIKRIASGIRLLPKFRFSIFGKVFSLMSKREKIWFLALLVLMGTSFLLVANFFYLSHTTSVTASGGQYREGLIGQPRLINPILATSGPDQALVQLVFSGLYKYDGSGNLVPDLADALPEVSPGQKHYTVKLKKNVVWHNDKTFTADDVVFTIQTLQNPDFHSPKRNDWINTKVEKIDDYTILFTNKDISGPFVQNLTQPILSKSLWQNVPAENFALSQDNLEAIGTGPYLIKEIKKMSSGKIRSISLESFSHYYQNKPNLDTVLLVFYDTYEDLINALHSKSISGFGFIPFDRNLYLDKNNKNLRILELPLPQYQAVFFNLGNKVLADRNVRKALNSATNKTDILNQVYNGSGRTIDGPLLPEQIGFKETTQSPDAQNSLAVAEAALDTAGWKLNSQTGLRTKNNLPLELTLSTNDFNLNVKAAEMLRDQWQKLHIKINLNILPTKELTDKVIRPRQFDMLLFGQKLGADPDPFAFWHSSQIKNPGLNLSGFANTAADKLITEARATTNLAVRQTKYGQFQDIIRAEVPAIFLNQSVYVYVIESSLKNVTLKNLADPKYRFSDIPNWYIDEKRVWK